MNEEFESLGFSRHQAEAEAGRQRLSRAARLGTSERVIRGAYMPTDDWKALSPRGQYLARITATAATRRSRPVISHQSAAAIHGLPVLDGWPRAVHVTLPPSVGAHSRASLIKHSARIPDEDLIMVGDLLVTSLARTVVDIAAASDFIAGVVTADGALYADADHDREPLTTKEELQAAWERASPLRAHARVGGVISFAETQSQTPIESVSRVNMRVLRAPRPELQVSYFDARGFIGETDFSWEEYGALGEADGDRKYLDAASRGGRAPERVFLDEKNREDRLRALPRKLARWPWIVARDPIRLRVKLKQLGLPLGVAWESAVS